jgi:hypothetical protein
MAGVLTAIEASPRTDGGFNASRHSDLFSIRTDFRQSNIFRGNLGERCLA